MTKIVDLLSGLKDHFKKLSFCQVLKIAREELGFRHYRAAEHMSMTWNRLKNLETGYFRVMPTDEEIKEISEFYDVDFQLLKEKAKKYLDERKNEGLKSA
jgi:hypothetical protein